MHTYSLDQCFGGGGKKNIRDQHGSFALETGT